MNSSFFKSKFSHTVILLFGQARIIQVKANKSLPQSRKLNWIQIESLFAEAKDLFQKSIRQASSDKQNAEAKRSEEREEEARRRRKRTESSSSSSTYGSNSSYDSSSSYSSSDSSSSSSSSDGGFSGGGGDFGGGGAGGDY